MVDREHGRQTPARRGHVLCRKVQREHARPGRRYVATGRRAVEQETNVPKTWRTQGVGSPRMPAGRPWPAPSCASKVRNAVGTGGARGGGQGVLHPADAFTTVGTRAYRNRNSRSNGEDEVWQGIRWS